MHVLADVLQSGSKVPIKYQWQPSFSSLIIMVKPGCIFLSMMIHMVISDTSWHKLPDFQVAEIWQELIYCLFGEPATTENLLLLGISPDMQEVTGVPPWSQVTQMIIVCQHKKSTGDDGQSAEVRNRGVSSLKNGFKTRSHPMSKYRCTSSPTKWPLNPLGEPYQVQNWGTSYPTKWRQVSANQKDL